MVSLLSRIFIRNKDTLSPEQIRGKYGILCGLLGIFLNILLFAGKILAGILTGAISITADAFNNLSDAGSSLITLLGFKLAGQKADSEHPFGHGRIEYVSGLIVSLLILLVGFELGKSSFEKILHPEAVEFSLVSTIILSVSVLVKLYMTFYNKRIGKRIGSPAMEATAADSLSDSVATFTVLCCMLIFRFFHVNIDAWCGLAVSGFILFSGLRAAKETISPLLGQPPTPELVGRIEEIVKSYPYVLDIHDLVVHDYGPGRMMISLHAEVPSRENLLDIHDAIDNAEKELCTVLDCEAVIHMDPIETDDLLTGELREKVASLVKTIDERITVHDFRMVTGTTHTNVIFDAVVPFGVKKSEKEVKKEIEDMVRSLDGTYYAVVSIDKSLVK